MYEWVISLIVRIWRRAMRLGVQDVQLPHQKAETDSTSYGREKKNSR